MNYTSLCAIILLCANISIYSSEYQPKSPKAVPAGQRSPNKNNEPALAQKQLFDVVDSDQFVSFEMLPGNKGRLYTCDNNSIEITILNCDKETEHVTQGYQEFKFQTRARRNPKVMVCEYVSKVYPAIQENMSDESSEESWSR